MQKNSVGFNEVCILKNQFTKVKLDENTLGKFHLVEVNEVHPSAQSSCLLKQNRRWKARSQSKKSTKAKS